MAEKVHDGVDGLHFRAGDPISLAKVMRRAIDTPGLWQTLHDQIKPVYGMDEHAQRLDAVYRDLLAKA
jgi:hypothetical protein